MSFFLGLSVLLKWFLPSVSFTTCNRTIAHLSSLLPPGTKWLVHYCYKVDSTSPPPVGAMHPHAGHLGQSSAHLYGSSVDQLARHSTLSFISLMYELGSEPPEILD